MYQKFQHAIQKLQQLFVLITLEHAFLLSLVLLTPWYLIGQIQYSFFNYEPTIFYFIYGVIFSTCVILPLSFFISIRRFLKKKQVNKKTMLFNSLSLFFTIIIFLVTGTTTFFFFQMLVFSIILISAEIRKYLFSNKLKM